MSTCDWHDWYAWHPVRINGGGWAWLSPVQRRWNWDLNQWGDFSGHSGTDGGWEYQRATEPAA